METDRIPRPEEAIRFLEKKINVPTERWDDLKWGEHAHAFTVAHSVEANILDDIHGRLNKAIASGESYDTWKKGMLGAMEQAGWYGGSGHTKDDKKYISWRLRVIYDTNMRTAYAAAQYRKQLQEAAGRPVWLYKSKVYGDNRRQEHLALHNKAFRYDDSFWDTYYPPNGWGCQCYVTTKSESGAEREGITVEDSSGMELPDIDPTWQYNPGREALAPNFNKYKNLPQSAITLAREKYRADMEAVKITSGELKVLRNEMIGQKPKRESEYAENNPILYLAGNLDEARQKAMNINDSKIMINGYRIFHGFSDKNAGQKLSEEHFEELYDLIQNPDEIYENLRPNQPQFGREFHFAKKIKGGKILNVVLRKLERFALQIITFGRIGDDHGNKNYKKIW
ncbi:MAG: phage head morphogenesis protein [Treponema sp.]|jgi:hypothetical protein|nr:phage head morphogenesis protein [Treponema sp.]